MVVEHVEEDLGPVNTVHETEDEVYDRLIAMCDEGIAKVHWRDRYKTEIELVKFENKGIVEDMEDFPQEIECKAKGGGVKSIQYDRLVAQMQRNRPSLSSDETERYILELSGMGFNDMVERIGIDIERDRGEEELFHDCQEEVGSAEDEKCLDKGKGWIQRSLFKLKEMISWRATALYKHE